MWGAVHAVHHVAGSHKLRSDCKLSTCLHLPPILCGSGCGGHPHCRGAQLGAEGRSGSDGHPGVRQGHRTQLRRALQVMVLPVHGPAQGRHRSGDPDHPGAPLLPGHGITGQHHQGSGMDGERLHAQCVQPQLCTRQQHRGHHGQVNQPVHLRVPVWHSGRCEHMQLCGSELPARPAGLQPADRCHPAQLVQHGQEHTPGHTQQHAPAAAGGAVSEQCACRCCCQGAAASRQLLRSSGGAPGVQRLPD
mmetsp:Transcript_5268/g.11544  ORF Transcript_5268/g.11544 Transcript_5268/m.11544 type:complete len:248 (-) Transcript_5268:457-1200(-)